LLLLLASMPLVAQLPLEDTRWRVLEIAGKPAASPPGTRQIYLRLTGQRVEAFAGCNTVSGAYRRDGEALKFDGLVSTRMMCPSMAIEDTFLRALGRTVAFAQQGATLQLKDQDGQTAARFESDDPWAKVMALEAGAEIRVIRKDALTKPVTGVFSEADAERLVLVVKNEQTAIARDKIQQIDARPKGGSRVTRTSTTTQNMPMDRPTPANPAERVRPVPPNSSSSTSSGLSMGGKPGFELVYKAR
jgi:heat shock protein HslJ